MEIEYSNNIEFDDDIWQQFCESLDVISVSVKDEIVKKSHGVIKIMFEHMIKYVYNPSKQSTSWVGSIIDGYIILSKVGIDQVSKYVNNTELDSCYIEGRRKAEKEDKCNTIKNSPKARPYNWNLDILTNIDSIKEFLYMHYNYENVYPFDIEEYVEYRLKNAKRK